jgi:polyisoprenoid-binding protein YceI
MIRHYASALVIAGSSVLMAFAPAATNWQVKKGAKANFSIDGLMGVDVNGTLAFKSAAISFDPAQPGSGKMQATLSVSTMATGIGKRDNHLKSDDYFEAAKYPDITFQSTRIEQAGNQGFKVSGNLKIKAVIKQVTIPFTFTQTGSDGEFKGDFRLNRVDYGIGNGKETGMGKEVRVKLSIPVRKV